MTEKEIRAATRLAVRKATGKAPQGKNLQLLESCGDSSNAYNWIYMRVLCRLYGQIVTIYYDAMINPDSSHKIQAIANVRIDTAA